MMNPKKGRLLIAKPSINDFIFFKSVILITHHCNKETIGFILNHPSKINLHQVLTNIPLKNIPLYIGGPIDDFSTKSINFIHNLGDIIPKSEEIDKGLFWGGDFKTVTELMHEKQVSSSNIRFFVGYSGWGSQQLQNEIKENSWIVNHFNIDICMQNSNEELWSQLIKKEDINNAIWTNMPKNPNLN